MRLAFPLRLALPVRFQASYASLPVIAGVVLLGASGQALAQTSPEAPEAAEQVTPEQASGQPASQVTASPQMGPSPDKPVQIDFNLSLASDYSTRGISQTGGKPVIQGGVEASGQYFYAGTWASNVDFGDGTDAEIDLYAGVRSQTAGIDWDLRALSYFYVNQPKGGDYNYMEYRASAAKTFGKTTLGAVAFYAPDYFGTTKDEAVFLQMTAAHQINDRWAVSGAVGRQWIPGPNDHTTWHFGPTYQATEKLSVDLRYYDTDAHHLGSDYDSRVVLSLNTNF